MQLFICRNGILHDLDFEMYPEEHCIKEQEIMRERGADMLGWTLDDLITGGQNGSN